MNLVHHFAGGAYAKETHFNAGERFPQHAHPHAHLAILAEGIAAVTTGEQTERFRAPVCITLPADVVHTVEAITPIVWFCVWATEDTDPQTVDDSIMKGA